MGIEISKLTAKVIVSLSWPGLGRWAGEFVNRMCFCLIFFGGFCKHMYFCYLGGVFGV